VNANCSLILVEKAVRRQTNVSHHKNSPFPNLPKYSITSTSSNGKRGPSGHYNDAGQTNPRSGSASNRWSTQHTSASTAASVSVSASAPIPRIYMLSTWRARGSAQRIRRRRYRGAYSTCDDECLWRRETISINDHLISTIYLASYPDIL
jgi:hypothetical protein